MGAENTTEKLASAVQGSKSKEGSYKSKNSHVDKQSVTTKIKIEHKQSSNTQEDLEASVSPYAIHNLIMRKRLFPPK